MGFGGWLAFPEVHVYNVYRKTSYLGHQGNTDHWPFHFDLVKAGTTPNNLKTDFVLEVLTRDH